MAFRSQTSARFSLQRSCVTGRFKSNQATQLGFNLSPYNASNGRSPTLMLRTLFVSLQLKLGLQVLLDSSLPSRQSR